MYTIVLTEEQEQDVMCFDDITGKDLPWHAVLRDLGVCDVVDEKEAVEKYGVTPVDTKWIDIDKSIRGRANANQITNVCGRVQK